MQADLLMAIADWLLNQRPLPFIKSQQGDVLAPPRPDSRILIIIPEEWVRSAPDRSGMIWMPQTTAMTAKLIGTIRTLSFDRERSTPDRLFVQWTIADHGHSRIEDWIVTRDAQGRLAIAIANAVTQ